MGNIFFTADLHLGHANIIKHCNRPFANVDEMDEGLIKNWNSVVARGDLVYLLGDFAMPEKQPNVPSMKIYARYFHQLNGKKVLVKGNHDHMSQEMYNHFTDVHDLKDMRIDRQFMTLCHYPMKSWNRSFHGAYQFFGHVHGRLPDIPHVLQMDVGVDCWDYTPVSWDKLKEVMDKKAVIAGDYWSKHRKTDSDY